jgi:hypothetical protein
VIAIRNAAEKIAPDWANVAVLAAVNDRLRNRRSGTIGSAAVRSRRMNPASSAARQQGDGEQDQARDVQPAPAQPVAGVRS